MLVTLGLVAFVVFFVDQGSKHLVVSSLSLGETVPVLGDVLVLHFVRNPGAAFSLASGSTWIFTVLAAVVVVVLVRLAPRIRSLVWSCFFGLLLGGTLGNLTDRLLREPGFGVGHVVDFIATPWLIPAIYNVADVSICTAMVLFVILTIRGVGLDGSRVVRPRGDDRADRADPTDESPTVVHTERS